MSPSLSNSTGSEQVIYEMVSKESYSHNTSAI